jgi:truncated hemoglobin YjbI
MTKRTKSLYDRLGGLDAVNALTESRVARVETDDRVTRRSSVTCFHADRAALLA